MKKILAIITVLCLMAFALCITAFAAEPADGTVLRVSALKKGSTDTVVIGDYDNFEDGWNYAMELAGDSSKMKVNYYDRVVVDIYANWNAEDGEFGSGDGFDSDAIYIPEDARVTFNLNGHTVNRGLTEDIDDGEVMFINDDADVIINNGTITGGYSNSEGGGLYIEGGAIVTLNDVNIVGNAVKGDDGAGIYLYGGATLVMNGGSVSNNSLDTRYILFLGYITPYGVICAEDSTVILNSVVFDGNYTYTYRTEGLVLYADGSTVKMDKCTVSNNATKEAVAEDIIYAIDSSLTITDTDFINNNIIEVPDGVMQLTPQLVYVYNSYLSLTGGTITKNGGEELFYIGYSEADITGATITDNQAGFLDINNGYEIVNVVGCTLGNNTPKGNHKAVEIWKDGNLVMLDCVLGDTTFSKLQYVKIATSAVTREEAVIGIELIREDGTVDSVRYYKDFESGWDYATESAETNAYDRVAVTLYADLNTNGYGVINVPSDTRMTLNLNGHTINRGLTSLLSDGEVMYIESNANLIIKDGTITGGYSENGAGGIHINSGANVTLQNVNIVGNTTDDDDGGGIALYGATLTMNGGSFQNNILRGPTFDCYGGAIYVNDGTATFNGVTFKSNVVMDDNHYGVAIYADDSVVTVNGCTFDGNGIDNEANEILTATSIIHAENSTINIKKSDFTNNGSTDGVSDTSSLITLDDSTLTVDEDCTFIDNAAYCIIRATDNDKFYVSNSNFSHNSSVVLISEDHSNNSFFSGCVFNQNKLPNSNDAFTFNVVEDVLTFFDCYLGDSTFEKNDTGFIKRVSTTVPEAEAVISVKGLLANGTVASNLHYKDFQGGWNAAVDLALTDAYDRVVVDLHADWVAKDGKFGDTNPGFKWDTIYIPQGVRITLNLNDHSIDRALADTWDDGMVIYIDMNADVIINNGSVKGGHSSGSAGGIQIMEGANVTLNNVDVCGNIVENDDGSAIAVYGATLTMNGGSIENNLLFNTEFFFGKSYGALYMNDATATLSGVKIAHNRISGYHTSRGVVIYLDDSILAMNNCEVMNNGRTEMVDANTLISVRGDESLLDIANCKFEGNEADGTVGIFDIDEGTLKVRDSSFTNNVTANIIYCDDGVIEVYGCRFEGNEESVFQGLAKGESKFDSCTFTDNNKRGYKTFYFSEGNQLEFTNCDFGNSTFNDRSRATFDGKAVGSVFGEGSLTNILVMISLVASVVAIFLTVYYNKKKAVPVAANGADESVDEE